MDEQLKSRFKKVLEHYAGVIKERDDALIREKTAREQFEASFRTVVDRVILPAAEQVKELVEAKNWICRATKADNALSAKIEIYQCNNDGRNRRAASYQIIGHGESQRRANLPRLLWLCIGAREYPSECAGGRHATVRYPARGSSAHGGRAAGQVQRRDRVLGPE